MPSQIQCVAWCCISAEFMYNALQSWPSGGTGRHAAFKMLFLRKWRFDSVLGYHFLPVLFIFYSKCIRSYIHGKYPIQRKPYFTWFSYYAVRSEFVFPHSALYTNNKSYKNCIWRIWLCRAHENIISKLENVESSKKSCYVPVEVEEAYIHCSEHISVLKQLGEKHIGVRMTYAIKAVCLFW